MVYCAVVICQTLLLCSEKYSSTLAWTTPWMEEPCRLQSMGLLRVRHDWATSLSLFTFTFHFHALEKEIATHSSVLAWRIPGIGEPHGLPSMGSHRVGHYWSNLAAAAAYYALLLQKPYEIEKINIATSYIGKPRERDCIVCLRLPGR